MTAHAVVTRCHFAALTPFWATDYLRKSRETFRRTGKNGVCASMVGATALVRTTFGAIGPCAALPKATELRSNKSCPGQEPDSK